MRGAPRALVGCESSGRVREALRRRGVDAWSCDLLPAEDGSPYHIQGDVLDVLNDGWDLGVFHPTCTYLANSGAKHLYNGMSKAGGVNPARWAAMEEAAGFYVKLWQAPIPRVAVENPVMHRHAIEAIQLRAPDHPRKRQFVQPWMFGHMEVKATGLALRGLPPLAPTRDVRAEMLRLPYGERAKVHYASPGPDRWRERSRTLTGVADAIAAQWGPTPAPRAVRERGI